MARAKRSRRPPRATPDKGGPWSFAFGRPRRIAAIFVILAILGAALTAGLLARSLAFDGSSSTPRTAVIVDQLSDREPSPAFVEQVTGTLEGAGYVVDYYSAEQVTVDFYRDLPAGDYDLIVMRAHAGRIRQASRADDVSLFTSEPYSKAAYVEDQRAGYLAYAFYEYGGPLFFGIPPEFIQSGMRGDFGGATVVLMGCDTLRGRATAEAFVARGADAVVGWDGLVSAEHTDVATERLLEHILADGLSTEEAVELTTQEVGPDPVYGSSLQVYPPPEAAAFALP